ncbi:MAG: hypothetical protein PHU85_20395 [Phycisphaerae bacterium]|nr:hypothetical protein [Phycisphaerae bacterium]
MFWIRYILVLPILLLLLAAGVVIAARQAWWADPLAPAGVLVVPDQVTVVGSPRNVQATIRPLQPSLAPGAWVGQAVLSTGEPEIFMAHSLGAGSLRTPASEDAGVACIQVRVSPEFGFGPLRSIGQVWQLPHGREVCLVDLEGLRGIGDSPAEVQVRGSSSRYQFSRAKRDWLTTEAHGCQPVYLADVRFEDYNDVRAQLQASGWPPGPLVMWRTWPHNAPAAKDRVVGDLRRRLNVVLAVAAEVGDNQMTLRQPERSGVPVIVWPRDEPPSR